MINFIDHIVLTVSNSKVSGAFYAKVLNWKVVEEGPDFAYVTPDSRKYPNCNFMLVLGESRDYRINDNRFDRNRIGLDHFAFQIDSLDELQQIASRLTALGIAMEDGGITDDGFGGTGIFCTDPDGMKLEFHLRVEAG